MEYKQTQHLTFLHRLRLAGEQWSRSYIFFCHVYAFVLGIVFILSSLTDRVPAPFTYSVWGSGGRLILGVAYVIASLYAAMYPERRGWLYAVILPAATGIPAAIWPVVNIAALIFWPTVLLTLFFEIRRRLYSGEWGRNE